MQTDSSSGSTNAEEGEAPKRSRTKKDEAPQSRGDAVVYRIVCASRSPLLMDRYDQDQMIRDLVKGERRVKDTESLLEVRCVDKIYRSEESGAPIIPADALLSCLKIAGRSIKVGKEGKVSTAKDTKLFAFLELEEFELPLVLPEGKNPKSDKPWKGGEDQSDLDPSSPWRVDVRRGVSPLTGIANAMIRPRFDQWGFVCTVTIDYTALEGLTESHVRQMFERAGSRVGLLSFRPGRGGPFGRFNLTSFEELKKE